MNVLMIMRQTEEVYVYIYIYWKMFNFPTELTYTRKKAEKGLLLHFNNFSATKSQIDLLSPAHRLTLTDMTNPLVLSRFLNGLAMEEHPSPRPILMAVSAGGMVVGAAGDARALVLNKAPREVEYIRDGSKNIK